MIKKNISKYHTSIDVNNSLQGETIEQKVRRIVNNKEPITDGAPLVYQDRGEIKAECDPRTDRWDLAVDAMDKKDKTLKAQRAERINQKKIQDNLKKGLDAEGKPIQGTKPD